MKDICVLKEKNCERLRPYGFVKVTAEILIFILCQQMFQILTRCQDVHGHQKGQMVPPWKEVSFS